MKENKYTEEDYCDLLEKKICDNCGKCLEEEGYDVRAINIDDIAKTVEENEFLIAEATNLIADNDLEEIEEAEETEEVGVEDYEDLLNEVGDSDYIDAFDRIEYLSDFDMDDEDSMLELTEEVFPGVRRLKNI